jgi:low temperature requirement protein LtrA
VDTLYLPLLSKFDPLKSWRQSFIPINVKLSMERSGLLFIIAIGDIVVTSVLQNVGQHSSFDTVRNVNRKLNVKQIVS